MAHRRLLVLLMISVLSFVGSAFLSFRWGVPEPHIHDEFSYLLAAETFSKGRLTNPSHPMGIYFESFHILQWPTYMSKYLPAQGLTLAFGKVLFGHPIVGVWFSVAVMCGLISWMLYQWVSPRWALIGGLFVLLQFGINTYWSYSYWGGTIPALGGALLFGSIRRVVRWFRIRDALLLGIGLSVLLFSRPFEGILISIPLVLMMVIWIFRRRGFLPQKVVLKICLPLLVILLPALLGMGFYNKTITGDPFKTPYALYEDTYTTVPLFVFQRMKEIPPLNHPSMDSRDEKFYGGTYSRRESLGKYLAFIFTALKELQWFYLPPVFIIPLILMLPWILRRKWMRVAASPVAVLLILIPLFLSVKVQAHYFAPVTSLIIVLVLQGYRYVTRLRITFLKESRMLGKTAVLLALGVAVFSVIGSLMTDPPKFLDKYGYAIPGLEANNWVTRRREIVKAMNQDEYRHLVLVRYGPDHDIHCEWIYNEPDIDSAKIVWAHDIGDRENLKLLRYFKDRRVWLLEVAYRGDWAKPVPYESEWY